VAGADRVAQAHSILIGQTTTVGEAAMDRLLATAWPLPDGVSMRNGRPPSKQV